MIPAFGEKRSKERVDILVVKLRVRCDISFTTEMEV